jgi:hypothetical protein
MNEERSGASWSVHAYFREEGMKRSISALCESPACFVKLGMGITRRAFPVVLLMACAMNTHAANVFSAASGTWGNPSTWSTGLIPSSSDNVFIGGGHTVTVDAGVACADLHVGRSTAIPNGGTLIFGNGTLHVLGDAIIGVASFGAGIVSMTQGELILDGSLTVPNGVFVATGGRVWYSGVADQTIASLSYHDLLLDNGLKIAGGPFTVGGNLTVYATATLDFGSFSHHLKGDLDCDRSTISGSGTVHLERTGGLQSVTGAWTFNNLVIDGDEVTLFSDIRVNGDLTINPGARLLFGGNVFNPTLTLTVLGDWRNDGAFGPDNPGPGTVVLAKPGDQNIYGTTTFQSLTLSGTGRKNAFGTLTVERAFTVGFGVIYHVQPAYDTHLKGGAAVIGTLDLGNTTMWYDGSGPQYIAAAQYGNLRLVGGTKTAAGNLDINGNLVILAGSTFDPVSGEQTLAGNLNNDGVILPGLGLTTFDGTGTQFIRGGGTTTFNSVGFINGPKTAESSFTVNDLFYIDGSASFDAGSNTITVKGDWTGGSTRFTAGTGKVILDSPSPQSINGGPTFKNLTLAGAGVKTATASITVDSIFIINPAATFSSGSFTHHINGDWLKTGTFLPNGGTISFGGHQPQLIIGSLRFNHVTVDNLAGVTLASASGDSVQGVLTFTRGHMMLGATDLTLEPSANITGATKGQCIVTNGSGRVRRTIPGGAGAGSFTFPIAPNTTSYNPVAVALRPDPAEPAETFTARVEPFTNASVGYGVMDTAFCTWRVWTIEEETVGGNRTNLAFQWDPDEDGSKIGIDLANPVSTMAYLYVNGTGQYEAVDDAVGPAPLNNPIIAATLGYTTLSFGSYIVGNAVALPVQFSSFTGRAVVNVGVRLDWQTVSEVNNYGFYVQRKRPADSAWTELARSFTPGSGTTTEPHAYTFVDSTVAGGEWQYRIRQVDLAGTSHYSETITVSAVTAVNQTPVPDAFALRQNYPNPFNPTTMIAFDLPVASEGNAAHDVRLSVTDVLGREVGVVFDGSLAPGSYRFPFDGARLSSGMYFCRLKTPDRSAVIRMHLVR